MCGEPVFAKMLILSTIMFILSIKISAKLWYNYLNAKKAEYIIQEKMK